MIEEELIVNLALGFWLTIIFHKSRPNLRLRLFEYIMAVVFNSYSRGPFAFVLAWRIVISFEAAMLAPGSVLSKLREDMSSSKTLSN
jgi:hypothetical protein